MFSSNALQPQAFESSVAFAGCWKLQPENAITLSAADGGFLRVKQGQVWATLDGPHQGAANDWGDLMLRCGDELQLMPGQHVVMEVFGEAANAPAYFCWEPTAANGKGAAAMDVPLQSYDVLARPWLGAVSNRPSQWIPRFGRLLRGLGNALSWLVAGRGRVLGALLSNQP